MDVWPPKPTPEDGPDLAQFQMRWRWLMPWRIGYVRNDDITIWYWRGRDYHLVFHITVRED